MRSANKLVDALDIHAGEGQLVGLLLLFSFCNGLVRTFTRSAAFALFLAVFSAQMLPYVYIGVSLIASLASFMYLQVAQRVPFARLLLGTLSAIILLFVALRLGIGLNAGTWLAFSLPIFYEVLLVMTNLALWNTAGRLLNVQQGKRLFGLIGTGEPTAAVVGGLLTAPIVALIGTPNLLLLAAGAVGVALLIATILARAHAAPLARAVEQRAHNDTPGSHGLLKNRYIVLIFSLYILAIISYFFVDNIFYAQAQLQYANANDLASFIGVFYAIVGVVWTLTNAFVIGALFKRYGLRASLIVAPAALGLSALAIALAGSLGVALVVIFWLAALAKLLSRICFDGLVKMSLNIAYQPLPTAQRVRAQTINEGLVYAGAIGLTGLLLSVLTNLLRLSSSQLAGVLLVVIVAWLAAAALLLREYPRQLLHALANRALGNGTGLSFLDAESSAVLQRALHDPHPEVAIYALRTLVANDDIAPLDLLPGMLQHPAPAVRREALGEIEQRGVNGLRDALHALLLHEPDGAVRGTAARVLATLHGGAMLDDLAAYLSDEEPLVRMGATVGLLRGGGIAGILAAGQQVLRWTASADPSERRLAARVLGEVGISNFDQPLSALIRDDNPQVRRAALTAAGQLASPRLWPLVIAALTTPATFKAASAALIAGGSAALPALAEASVSEEPMLQLRLAHVCGRIGGNGAIALLLPHLNHPAPTVRTEVLHALTRCGYRVPAAERGRFQQQIYAEATMAGWALAALAECDEACGTLLPRALAAEVAAAQQRILYLLGLLADPRALARARRALASDSSEQRAYALEIIETQITQELKAWVIPLMSDLPLPQKLQRVSMSAPQRTLGRSARLAELIAGADGQLAIWTRACAIHTAGELGLVELAPAVAAAQDLPEPLLRETATWAIARLAPRYSSAQITPATGPLTASIAARYQGASRMLSRIEKVLILKTVGIFLETPDDVLAEVAALLEETEAPAGTTIIQKGDTGTSMYIIVDGEVRVYDGSHTLNHLHARDVFGEMALLDPEPRVASVTALADTRLLRLDQEPFYELMEEHNQVARGVIRMLTRHLRARVRDLAEARAQLAALPPTLSTVSPAAPIEPR
jgi:ATP/ADP translocase/HEAT repeat protein